MHILKKKTYTHPKLTKGENDFLKKVLLVVALMSWKKTLKLSFTVFSPVGQSF